MPWIPPSLEYAGPDGVPYHRLLQRRGGAWWRAICGVLIGAAGLVLGPVLPVWGVVVGARLLGYDDFSFSFDDGLGAAELLAVNLGLALLIPISMLAVRLVYGRPPRWLSSVRPGLRLSWLGLCVAMAFVVWGLLLVLATAGAAVERESPVDSTVVWFLVVVLVTTPLQATGEEFLFRGLLLQGLGATRLPTWLCCGVAGAMFASAHLQFSPPLFADRFLLGVVLAWLAIRTGGLEAGIALHTVKNLAGLIPAALLDEVSATLDPENVNWLPFAVDVVLLSIVVPWLLAVVRRKERQGRLRTTYGTAPTGPAIPV